MNKFFKYFRAQLKRGAKIYPVILIFTLVLSSCLALLLGGMLSSEDASSSAIIEIGVVGDLEGTGLDFGIEAIQSLDSSRSYARLITMDEETAEKKLADDEIAGYIYISETFVNSLKKSENEPLIFKTKNIPAALSSMLTSELVAIISDYIVDSQNSVLSLKEVKGEYDLDINMNDANLHFINKVMDRENIYETHEVGVGKGLGFSNYFIFAFIILLLMLWGISGSAFLIKKDMALPALLKSSGHSVISQVLGDYLPFLLMMVLNLLLLFAGLSFITLPEGFWVLSASLENPVITVLKLIPAAALISSMQFFLYELCTNTITALLTQLLAVLALSYASGLIYPLNALPMTLQKASAFLPSGLGFEYTVQVLTNNISPVTFAAALGFCALFIALSVVARERKLRSCIA